jgi:hypothetical protein
VRFAAYPCIQFDRDTKGIKGNVMQQSNIFKELEAMIEKDWLVKSLTELDSMLKQLVQNQQITLADYRSLLEKYLGRFKTVQ